MKSRDADPALQLRDMFDGGYNVVHACTTDQRELIVDLCRVFGELIADDEPYQIVTWDTERGFILYDKCDFRVAKPMPPGLIAVEGNQQRPIVDPTMALKQIVTQPVKCRIFVMHNLDSYCQASAALRQIVENFVVGTRINNADCRQMIVSVSVNSTLHQWLTDHVPVVRFRPPTGDRLLAVIDENINNLKAGYPDGTHTALGSDTRVSELRPKLLRVGSGLTAQQFTNVFSSAFVSAGDLDEGFLRAMKDHTAAMIATCDFLEYVPDHKAPDPASLIGFDNAERYLRLLSLGLTPEGRALNLAKPTGFALVGPAGSGKCLGVDTPVLMFDGTVKKVQDVKTGELVMGPDSKPRKVLGTTRGYGPLFRVTPVKGDAYVVNDAHVLSLVKYVGKDGKKRRTVAIPVADYAAMSTGHRKAYEGWRTGVDWPEQPLPLPPYILGIWLGDGTAKQPEVTTPDAEVVAALRQYAEENNLTVVKRPGKARGKASTYYLASGPRGGRRSNVLLTTLRDLEVIANKHIPESYLVNSRANRLALLAGLLDSDGYLGRGTYEITQKSQKLANQIAFLARSLGFAAYVFPKKCTIKSLGFEGNYFAVSISGHTDVIPTRIARKRAAPRQQVKNVQVTGITVKAIGDGDYYGFELDGDHLFLLGDFTVTHNSQFAMTYARRLSEQTDSDYKFFLLNAGQLLSKYVGESEDNLERVLETFDATGGCVVLVDECEKVLGAAIGDGSDDSTSSEMMRRMGGRLLSWMANEDKSAIVLATMNDIKGVSDAFLRRFDLTLYTDLPDDEARRQLFGEMLRRRAATAEWLNDDAEWKPLQLATEDFSGAEIRKIVNMACNIAFDVRKTLNIAPDDMQQAVDMIKPTTMIVMRPEQLNAMRTKLPSFGIPVATPAKKRQDPLGDLLSKSTGKRRAVKSRAENN